MRLELPMEADTLPPTSAEDTQPQQAQREQRMTRKVTFDVNATPLGASASDFVFARSDEWVVAPDGRIVTPGPPGTWQFFEGRGILTRCPRCKSVAYLMPQVSKVMPDGRIDPDLRCMAKPPSGVCGWAARAYLDKAWGKTLYAIAVMNHNKQRRGKDPREIHYAVGNSQQEAMTQVILERGCTVIAVGPAVGFKVTDKHGEKLIAEG
jgi:hypothetical protein